MGKGGDKESVDATLYRKKLAVAQGELDGYICKVEGFKRALEELEMQMVEKDLQVAMLKSVITEADDPAALEYRLIETLEHNHQLQLQVQKVTAQLAIAHAAAAAAAATPRASQQQQHHRRRWHETAPSSSSSSAHDHHQQQDCQTTQLLMLRKALTAANMRLTSNGLLPVAATSDLLQAQDFIDSWPGDQGVAFASYTPAQPAALAPAPNSNTSSSSSSEERSSSPLPDLPALCLLSKLSAVSVEGASTPLSGGGERFLHNSSRCSTPVETPTPGRTSEDGTSSDTASCTEPAAAAVGNTIANAASVVIASGGVSGAASSSMAVKGPAVPAAALRSCTWHSKGPADYSSSSSEDDSESVAESELSDDYDAGELGVYPGSETYGGETCSMATPVLDNPLFLHNRPECSGCC